METDAKRLLQRCQNGDEAALADLMRLYQKRVYQFILRVSRDSSLAEEATVDCFYRIWTKCGQHRDDASPEAWIFRIAHRAVLDLARKQQRWWRRLGNGSRTTEDDLQPSPLEALVETERQQWLATVVGSAMETLKEEDRALIHLYYYEEQSLSEIAIILETSRDALKMRLMRARGRLGRLLESDDVQR